MFSDRHEENFIDYSWRLHVACVDTTPASYTVSFMVGVSLSPYY
jgi:hypothetical protein